jgi:hypothetical protein
VRCAVSSLTSRSRQRPDFLVLVVGLGRLAADGDFASPDGGRAGPVEPVVGGCRAAVVFSWTTC